MTLVCAWLGAEHGVRQAVIRTDPANSPSAAVAVRAGFRPAHGAADGHRDWYVRDLTDLRGR